MISSVSRANSPDQHLGNIRRKAGFRHKRQSQENSEISTPLSTSCQTFWPTTSNQASGTTADRDTVQANLTIQTISRADKLPNRLEKKSIPTIWTHWMWKPSLSDRVQISTRKRTLPEKTRGTTLEQGVRQKPEFRPEWGTLASGNEARVSLTSTWLPKWCHHLRTHWTINSLGWIWSAKMFAFDLHQHIFSFNR